MPSHFVSSRYYLQGTANARRLSDVAASSSHLPIQHVISTPSALKAEKNISEVESSSHKGTPDNTTHIFNDTDITASNSASSTSSLQIPASATLPPIDDKIRQAWLNCRPTVLLENWPDTPQLRWSTQTDRLSLVKSFQIFVDGVLQDDHTAALSAVLTRLLDEKSKQPVHIVVRAVAVYSELEPLDSDPVVITHELLQKVAHLTDEPEAVQAPPSPHMVELKLDKVDFIGCRFSWAYDEHLHNENPWILEINGTPSIEIPSDAREVPESDAGL